VDRSFVDLSNEATSCGFNLVRSGSPTDRCSIYQRFYPEFSACRSIAFLIVYITAKTVKKALILLLTQHRDKDFK